MHYSLKVVTVVGKQTQVLGLTRMQVVMIQRLDGTAEYKGTTGEKVDPCAFFLRFLCAVF